MKGSIPLDYELKEQTTPVKGFTHFIKLFRRNKSGKEISNKK